MLSVINEVFLKEKFITMRKLLDKITDFIPGILVFLIMAGFGFFVAAVFPGGKIED